MDFPNLVYRCPGEHQRPGGTYGYRAVQDESQLQDALAAGWFKTLPEAIEGKAAASEKQQEQAPEAPADNDAPPTRAELEQKAAELGITFSPNIGDKKLAEKIAAALKD